MSDQKYQLLVQRGPEPGKIYPLSSVSITIGRDPMADITIADPEVSRQHVRLSGTLAGYKIQDLGSTNGTYVDGERLGGEAVELTGGQIITIGAGVSLRFQSESGDQDGLLTILDGTLPASDFVLDNGEDNGDSSDAVEEDEISPIASETPRDDLEPVSDVSGGIEGDEKPMPIVIPSLEEPLPEQVRDHDWGANYQNSAEPDDSHSETGGDPVVIPHQGDEEQEGKPSNRRTPAIIVSLILLIICCCCSFFLFIYYYGGDWMLRQMGLLP